MSTIIFEAHDGTRTEIAGTPGQSVMQIATTSKVPGIVGECGGTLSCATCHCYIESPWAERLPAPDDAEKIMVDCAIEVRETSRLSCQIKFTDDLDGIVVKTPVSQY